MFISCSVSLSRVQRRVENRGSRHEKHEKLNNLTRRHFIAVSYYSGPSDVYTAEHVSVTRRGRASGRLSKMSASEEGGGVVLESIDFFLKPIISGFPSSGLYGQRFVNPTWFFLKLLPQSWRRTIV